MGPGYEALAASHVHDRDAQFGVRARWSTAGVLVCWRSEHDQSVAWDALRTRDVWPRMAVNDQASRRNRRDLVMSKSASRGASPSRVIRRSSETDLMSSHLA